MGQIKDTKNVYPKMKLYVKALGTLQFENLMVMSTKHEQKKCKHVRHYNIKLTQPECIEENIQN